jgi:hypothetical protein
VLFEPNKSLFPKDLTNSVFVIFSRGCAGLQWDSVSKLFFRKMEILSKDRTGGGFNKWLSSLLRNSQV